MRKKLFYILNNNVCTLEGAVALKLDKKFINGFKLFEIDHGPGETIKFGYFIYRA